MNSPGSCSSPSYRNLKIRNKQSPIEIKEKIRKSYREKVHNCRNTLLNSLRGAVIENDVRNTLDEIYRSMFNWNGEPTSDEEDKLLDEIREELVREEVNWCIQEYEKYQNDIDWNSLETEHVICPVCQKANLTLDAGTISCLICRFEIKSEQNISDIKNIITACLEKHSTACIYDAQFIAIPDENGIHIYLLCASCNNMQTIL